MKKNSKLSRTLATESDGWVLVRTGKRAPWRSLQVPFTVGAHIDNDVFVNAPTMRQISKIAVVDQGFVVFVDAQTMNPVDGSDLKAIGIDVVGVFNHDPQNVGLVGRFAKKIQCREDAAFRSLPSRYRRFFPRKQSLRFGFLACFGLMFSAFLASNSPDGMGVQDLSSTPILASVNNVADLKIKSEGVNSPYSKGFMLEFDATAKSPSADYVLTVSATGLDVADEFTILINEKVIGSTQASISCADSICLRDFPVSADLLAGGPFKMTFRHNDAASSYFIKSVFLRGMEPATEEDREMVTQLLVSAERHYDERHLLVQNIRSALDAIQSVEDILATKQGLAPIKARFNVSKAKISAAFKETSSDYQFRLQKELKLGHNKVALGLVNDLMKLYPDPTSRQYLMLLEQRKVLQEAQK